jgi:predicted transcriptional regulator
MTISDWNRLVCTWDVALPFYFKMGLNKTRPFSMMEVASTLGRNPRSIASKCTRRLRDYEVIRNQDPTKVRGLKPARYIFTIKFLAWAGQQSDPSIQKGAAA